MSGVRRWLMHQWPTCIIGYAAALHIVWAILLAVAGPQIGATPTASLRAGFGPLVSVVLGWSAIVATAAVSLRLPVFWLFPQQTVLIISAHDSLMAVLHQSYADGVPRPMAFIAADQAPVILAAIFHLFALVGYEAWRRHERRA